ncbi:alpha/beta fold hydrolase [Streptomyces indicus]|uniref:Pimeloyl-ACP methyl ester carboxylesterase n=1 Tax=Streptomyces indicus TaxID=417292 RepID=A0A1G8ZP81_9ACTN|nr:alpha/beta hydrolase [Streptomyces indicus]SDK16861.1 Pimeloyl-ACP methyl ester carboxylesterase [Streptomyces indicus]
MTATFTAYDGTRLAFHVQGSGPPLICLPGGMQAAAYLGDLGGLARHRQVITLDLRGTGDSAAPEDPGTYRCDRLVDDVEALRAHLGLETFDLLGHCAGANLAVLYATRHPGRVARLLLVTPSVLAVGLPVSAADRRACVLLRRGEPWFDEAYTAFEAVAAGRAGPAQWEAIAPFSYGSWDEAARAHHAREAVERNGAAFAVFAGEGAFAPEATRAALAAFPVPVLLLAGEVDLGAPPAVVRAYARLLPHATYAEQSGAGHFPWLDDPDAFSATVVDFLS